MPLNGEKLWRRTPYDKFLPPRYRRMSGRPKKQHNNELYEARRKNPSKTSKKGRRMKCSKCGQEGHNKKTCRGPPNVSNWISFIYSYFSYVLASVLWQYVCLVCELWFCVFGSMFFVADVCLVCELWLCVFSSMYA